MLTTWHNLQYYQNLMAGMRNAIDNGGFDSYVADFEVRQAIGDIDPL
jgi:queuine tRNA-ribosyltransferase